VINKNHIGSSFDEFLAEEGILEEVNIVALKRTIAWEIDQAMQQKGMTKTDMAKAMQTSRASLERLLDPQNTSVTLRSIAKAAKAIGKQIKLELV
jgi:antitoxin HicB